MTIRPIVDIDYHMIEGMWASWGSPAPPRDFLPDVGFIVVDEKMEVPVCAGYLYITNSKCCWQEWVVTNKHYTNRKKRKIALHLLLDTMTNVCIESGYKYVFAVIKSEPLIKIYEDAGFTKGGTGIEMFKKL